MSAGARRATQPAAEDMRARIEEVATRLFITHGYNGVSYLDIGRALGLTHSNIHYYYRTKDVLAAAVLDRVAETTLASMRAIWTNTDTSLFEKLVAIRDYIHREYMRFNPGGKGGRSWGLIARFSLDADALTPAMRKTIRASLDELDDCVAQGVAAAIERGELARDAPAEGIALQIASLLSATGQLTRRWSGFERLHALFRWTYEGIVLAYGKHPRRPPPWPPLT